MRMAAPSPSPQPLLAPSGLGISSIPLTSHGSGYIDTPIITITGGTGSGATAVAQINPATGAVTNILDHQSRQWICQR